MRVASLLASSTEIIHVLGCVDRLVGVSHECDYPASVTALPRLTRSLIDDSQASGAIDDQVRDRLSEGQPLYEVDEPLLAQLRPDIIVTQAQCDVCAVRLEDVQTAVRRTPALADARVVTLNPFHFEDVLRDVRTVAEALEVVPAAEAFDHQCRERLAAVRRSSTPPSPPPRVAIVEWIEPLMLAANWTPDLVQLAGGVHQLTRAGQHSVFHPWQDVVDYDPDVIVVAPCGFDLPRTLTECQLLRDLPEWQGLRAVREGRAYALDGNVYLNRSGPRLVDTIEVLAHLLHPDTCPAIWPQAGIWQPLHQRPD